MAHSRGFPRRTGSQSVQRRQTAWSIGPAEVDGLNSSSVATLWSSGVVPLVDGLTIVRLRGIMKLTLLTAGAAGDGFFGACGIGIVTDEAFAAGITAVPGPLTDEGDELWMWHSYFDVRSITATIADGVNAAGVVALLPIDSKAMRKIPSGNTVFGITELVESGAATVESQAQCRMLSKLP